MGLLDLFSSGASATRQALRNGAVIIDVRPPYKYDQGKIRDSLNIPIEQIAKNAGYIKRLGRPIVLCGDGSDSSTAKRILQHHGLKDVHNGGSWERVLRMLKSV